MDSRNKQIPAPKSWQSFEDLCLSLFRAIWKNPYAQKNGRQGQPQHGVDVHGTANGDLSRYHGVQCKGKDAALGSTVSAQEMLDEIAKAEMFSPPLTHWVLATTAPPDAELQKIAREVSVERERQGKFTITVYGWSEIENLLCEYPEVLAAFYPELGIDTALLVRQIQQAVSGTAIPGLTSVNGCSTAGLWRRVEFQSTRDIGPALLGRPLGPSDALACPRLPEADRVVLQLEAAFSARLVGVPGAGKSVCAYQVARTFAERDYDVFIATSVDAALEAIPQPREKGVLILVDDAHLISDAALRSAEDRSASRLLVLSTHNATEGISSQRGAVRMDPAAGINAIASGLLVDRSATLLAVRRADSHVGDLMMDDALEERVAHASRYATVPWQFCFVLGGGWRRANEAVGAARALKLDHLLAAIAIRQLASRDASPSANDIAALLRAAGFEVENLKRDLHRLVIERLVVSEDDLRCPHQRLAAVLLGRLLQHQSSAGISALAAMLKATLANTSLPLAGLGTLLHELHFADYGKWRSLVDKVALKPVLDRCWLATEPENVMASCFVLNEAMSYLDGSEDNILQDNEKTLRNWIENAVNPMGHGLARLLNTLLNQKENYAIGLIRSVNPIVVAKLISDVDAASVWHVAELVKTLRLGIGDLWSREVIDSLDDQKLLVLAASWPEQEPTYRLISLFEALVWPAEARTLDLVEAFLPIARRKLISSPVEEFQHLDGLAMHVLRVLDPLGVYAGELAPTFRHLRIARKLFDGIDLSDLAVKLSQAPLRSFQQVSYLIAFLNKASPKKASKLIHLMDWDALSSTIGDHWSHLPHEVQVLFGVASASCKSCDPVVALIEKNLGRMDTMPARLAVIAPKSALEFVRQGKKIALSHFEHVEWRYGPFIIALFAQEAPQLLPIVLTQCIPTLAKTIAQHNESWYRECVPMLEGMLKHSPESLQMAFDEMNVEGARVGWVAAWAAGGKSRRTVRVLLRAAEGRLDALGEFARQFKKP